MIAIGTPCDEVDAPARWTLPSCAKCFGFAVFAFLVALNHEALAQANFESGVAPAASGGTFIPGVGAYGPPGAAGARPVGAVGQRGLLIEPSVTLTTTYTDNANLTSVGRQSDVILGVRPGIRVVSNGGRVQGSFDYALQSLVYSNGTSGNSIQHFLNTRGAVEVISDLAFVDFAGSVSRQSISAFGLQASDPSRSNSNTTQQSRYSISPYVRGRFDDSANYQFRYSYSKSFSEAQQASDADVQVNNWTGVLNEDYPGQQFGWLLQASRSYLDYKKARDIEADRFGGVLTFIATPSHSSS